VCCERVLTEASVLSMRAVRAAYAARRLALLFPLGQKSLVLQGRKFQQGCLCWHASNTSACTAVACQDMCSRHAHAQLWPSKPKALRHRAWRKCPKLPNSGLWDGHERHAAQLQHCPPSALHFSQESRKSTCKPASIKHMYPHQPTCINARVPNHFLCS